MKKAAVAVAHRILMLAYYIIRDGSIYQEAGGEVYDRRNPERTAKRLARRLQRIGYEVTLTPVPRTTRSPQRTALARSNLHQMQRLGYPLHPRQAAETPRKQEIISLIPRCLRSVEFRRNGMMAIPFTGRSDQV